MLNMALTSQHITGFAVGIGVAAVGFYMYKQNEHEVDEWLRGHGIELPTATVKDYGVLTLEELVLEKERLEDLIAERELAAQEQADQPSADSTPSTDS
jgi:hypothetical protein